MSPGIVTGLDPSHVDAESPLLGITLDAKAIESLPAETPLELALLAARSPGSYTAPDFST